MAGHIPHDPDLRQHLLVDEDAIAALVDAAAIQPGDVVLEVGAGPGNLTRRFAERAGNVVAYEVAERFAPELASALANLDNVELVMGDVRRGALPPFDVMAGNPPFHLLETLVGILVDRSRQFRSATLLTGQPYRLAALARPGETAYSRTSLVTQAKFTVEIVRLLPPASLRPPVARTGILTLRPAPGACPALTALADAVRGRAGQRVRDFLWHLRISGASTLRRVSDRRALAERVHDDARVTGLLPLASRPSRTPSSACW